MKHRLLAFLILYSFIPLFALAQEGNIEMEGDTLVIVHSEFVRDPFGIGESPRAYFLKKGVPTKSVPRPNLHIQNQIDTLLLAQDDLNSFQIYKAEESEFMTEAEIKSEDYLVQSQLKVGMSKTDFKQLFGFDAASELPGYIRVRDFEYMTWMDFNFREEILIRIRYYAQYD